VVSLGNDDTGRLVYQYGLTMTGALAAAAPRRGRKPAASRDDVLEAALHRYLRGRRIDVRAIANELGLGRTTIYRWFGSREGLVEETVARAAEPLFDDARASARGQGGAALLDTFDRINRGLATAPALRSFLELERDALRILTSSGSVVHSRAVAKIQRFVEDEVQSGAYRSPVDTATLAYAIVRLAEAFLFNDATAAVRGDVDRLREIEGALLGVSLPPARPT
jgi:AcrR family transcriptional regulator